MGTAVIPFRLPAAPRISFDGIMRTLKDFPNADYRQLLLELLDKVNSSAVRCQIIASLHTFRSDSQVEDRLWQLSQNDPDRGL